MLLMIGITFAAAALVVALTVYSGVVERLREYGIVKAMGAGSWAIVQLVLGQTILLAIAGGGLGYLMYLGGAWLVALARPQFWFLLEWRDVLVLSSAATGMALVAAIIPAATSGGSNRRRSTEGGDMVPVARRMLFTDRRRAVLGVVGVAIALVMVLALDGIFAGTTRQVSRYIDTSPADVFVSQEGVRTIHMAISAIPARVVDRVSKVRGVAWAEPVLRERCPPRGGRTKSKLRHRLPTGRPGRSTDAR